MKQISVGRSCKSTSDRIGGRPPKTTIGWIIIGTHLMDIICWFYKS